MSKKLFCLFSRLIAILFLNKCGKNFRLGHSSHLKGYKNIDVGGNFFSGPYLYLNTNKISRIVIGDDVMMGPYVKVISGNHIIDYKYGPMNSAPAKQEGHDKGVTIEDDVWIGVNAIILDGAFISEGVVVGAGSLVNKYIPPYVIAAGNPLRVIRLRFSLSDLAIVLNEKKSRMSLDDIKNIYADFGLIDV